MRIPIISFITCFSYLIPISVGVARYKRLTTSMRIFFFFLVVSFFEYVLELIFSLYRMNTLEIINYGMLIETCWMCVVYIVAVKLRIFRRVIYALLGIYAAAWLLIRVFLHVPYVIDSGAVTFGMAVIVCAGIAYLYYELKVTTNPIITRPMFWMTVGSLLCNVGSIILFALANELTKMGYAVFLHAWYITFSLLIIANLFYTKAFLCRIP